MNRRVFLASTIFLPMVIRNQLFEHSTVPTGFGIGIPWQPADTDPTWYSRVLATLNPPWWHNWKFDQIDQQRNIPVFWRPQTGALFEKAVQAANQYPNKLWLLFNAPERQQQTNTDPAMAAQIATEWRTSTHDQFSVGGVAPDVRGLNWLSGYLDAGGPVPAAWHFHVYGVSDGETWQAIFGDFFQQWYGEKGMGRPVVVSEVTATRGSSLAEQQEVMSAISASLPSQPIIGSGWFSAYDPLGEWSSADLVDENGIATPLGEFYRELDQ